MDDKKKSNPCPCMKFPTSKVKIFQIKYKYQQKGSTRQKTKSRPDADWPSALHMQICFLRCKLLQMKNILAWFLKQPVAICSILYKGLDHLWILIPAKDPRINPPRQLGTTVHIYMYKEKETSKLLEKNTLFNEWYYIWTKNIFNLTI